MTETIFIIPVNPRSTAAMHLYPIRHLINPTIWLVSDESEEGSLELIAELRETLGTIGITEVLEVKVPIFDYYAVLFTFNQLLEDPKTSLIRSDASYKIVINEGTNVAPTACAIAQAFQIRALETKKKGSPSILIHQLFIQRNERNVPTKNFMFLLPDSSCVLSPEELKVLQVIREHKDGFLSQVALLEEVIARQIIPDIDADKKGQMKIGRILRRLDDHGFIEITNLPKTNKIEIKKPLR
jgi:hypothetical protein